MASDGKVYGGSHGGLRFLGALVTPNYKYVPLRKLMGAPIKVS
jgi:hypothetical protein